MLKPLGPTKVKGVSEPVNVYEVTGLGPLRTRLQRDTNRRDEASTMLADIYNWFTYGFDTVDLEETKSLLEELTSTRTGAH